MHKLKTRGFTLIEITVVITVIGILAAITYSIAVPKWRARSYYVRSLSELNTMGNAMNLYVAKYNDYPPDVSRNIPAGIKEFIQGQEGADDWPAAPYPNTVYDYDNWPADSIGTQTYQISLRFCDAGQDAVCKANAQKYLSSYVSPSVLSNWDSYSSVYYCIKGSCRSHQNKPLTHPGLCINCGTNKRQIY